MTALKINNLDLQVRCLEYHVRTEGIPLAVLAMGMSTIGQGVGHEIFVRPLNAIVIRKFRVLGVTVRHISMQYRQALVAISDLTLLYSFARISEG